jgi:omega-amidase
MICRGEVVTSAEEKEVIIYGDVDLDRLEQVRTSVPISKQKRQELYNSAAAKV